jgi:hypothetical protein
MAKFDVLFEVRTEFLNITLTLNFFFQIYLALPINPQNVLNTIRSNMSELVDETRCKM